LISALFKQAGTFDACIPVAAGIGVPYSWHLQHFLQADASNKNTNF